MRLFIFGYGYAAQALARRVVPKGWSVSATVRDPNDAPKVSADGVAAISVADHLGIAAVVAGADAILVTAPPTEEGCPGFDALAHFLRISPSVPDWVGYLSTTGVYGDRSGEWVSEESALAAKSVEGKRRVAAEREWLHLGSEEDVSVQIFRLPGLYGQGRSALDKLRAGEARRIAAPDQVFSRIHIDDLAAALEASIAHPRASAIYNICDDEPAPNSDVVAYAAVLLGVEPPPEIPLEQADLSAKAQRFYEESKRVSNARAKAELGWTPAYPSYREGLAAILDAG